MENYKNLKEDNDLFPYEYGASSIDQMRESIFALLRREELASSVRSIYQHMEENGVVFSSPGGSFKRKFCNNLSEYMNFRIRYPRRGENLKKDDKLRQLLEPLAKILCTEKNILEKWKKKNPNGYAEYNYPGGKKYAGEWKDCNIMDKEFFLCLVELFMKGDGIMGKDMVKERLWLKMTIMGIRENGRTINFMDKEFSFGRMGILLKS